ncbi:von Willebrand factor A [Hyphomicrobium nitrativorans NL23]|uniref:von Willebrand factor A n=1 Tax=Hyphomicrobium nitrativorans NL23 TaxID=1029756 RepID=V5SAF2_9HYPH|nr:VWA domain-containing protein [Hyphomicrobium nitrativorans]AHB47618.1 von Willebrand factor A [Hyphomicrobium nitrativorans NL23]
MSFVRTVTPLLGLAAFSAAMLSSAVETQAAEVRLAAELGHAVIDAKTKDKIYLRLSLKALGQRERDRRTPINVALVIDRSGSMQGERLAAAKKGVEAALERLGPDDIVSLVAYNHEVDVLLRAGRLGAKRDDAERAIGRLTATGTTALYAGVKEGGEQVQSHRSDMQVNRVVLLSDGLANVGPSSTREVAALGQTLAGKGISVSTIGLGLEYNDELMQRLAAVSDGNHVFVERPSDLAEIFDREFGDALSIAARDITITIECKAGFRPTRVLGRDAEIAGSRVTVNLAQLQADNERYVVVELEPSVPYKGGRAEEVARVDVAYLNLDGGSRDAVAASVKARFTDDAKEAEGSINKAVMSQVTEQIATENSERAMELRNQGDVAAARQVLIDNASYLSRNKNMFGSGNAPAPSASISTLDKLEERSREAAASLEEGDWERTRRAMRHDQHKSKVQQAY